MPKGVQTASTDSRGSFKNYQFDSDSSNCASEV